MEQPVTVDVITDIKIIQLIERTCELKLKQMFIETYLKMFRTH